MLGILTVAELRFLRMTVKKTKLFVKIIFLIKLGSKGRIRAHCRIICDTTF